jgi:uncharacterized protein
MELVLIAVVAAIASLLTFFTGFGLATILTPVMVLLFPVEIAIALTGIVHLLNNFFKLGLTGRNIDWKTGLRFGLPAIAGAFAGAALLLQFSDSPALYTYTIGSKEFRIMPVKIIIAILMIGFALFELIPALKKIKFKENKIYIGGLVSGFFGGLSGHQGALRSAFLLRSGLSKMAFIATGILIACMVDLTRLSVYFSRMSAINITENITILVVAVLSAFIGAFVGNRLLKKVTLRFVELSVTLMVIAIAIALGTGLI